MAYNPDAVDYTESRMSPEPFPEKEPHGQVPRKDTRTRSPHLGTLPLVSRRFWEQSSIDDKGKEIARRPSPRTPGSPPARSKQYSRPQAELESGNSGDAKLQSGSVSDDEEIDFVYTSAEVGKYSSFKNSLQFTPVEDLDDELEELGRLTRAGNFRAAKALFSQRLKGHIDNPLVFILYAELLLEIGDYESITQLEDIAQTAVPRPQHEDEDRTASSPYTKLYVNWRLIHLIACGRNKQDLSGIHVDLEKLCLAALRSETFDSTQARIFFLLSRSWNTGRFGSVLSKDYLLFRQDWKAGYSLLVDEQRAWDFRDMFLAFINLVDPEGPLKMDFFFDSETPKDFCDRLEEDWLTENPDVSVYLALMDLLCSMVMALVSHNTAWDFVAEALKFADELGEKLMACWPEQTGSRPYLIWLLSKAVTAGVQKGSNPSGIYERVPCSAPRAGPVVLPVSKAMMPALPFYIPKNAENPGWSVSATPISITRALRVVRGIAQGLENYALQATCICELAKRSDEPIALMDELADVQRDQGDLYGRLETCLAKYLVCQTEELKQALRQELVSFGYWEDVENLSAFQTMLVATRDVQLRALSPTDMMAFKSSISAALPYYARLPLFFQKHVNGNSYARDRRERSPPPIPSKRPHRESGHFETTHEAAERRRRWREEKSITQKQSSRSSARRERSVPRPQGQVVNREEIVTVDDPQKYTSTRTLPPIEHPEQSEKQQPATFATVQSVSSSSSTPSFHDGPEVTEWVEDKSSESAKKKQASDQENLSPQEDFKIVDQVGHERGLGREFPSAASRAKRPTSVDLGEFSRRS